MIINIMLYIFYSFYFSDIGFKNLRETASSTMFNLRAVRGSPSDTFLVPKGTGAWGNKSKINKDTITLAMAEQKVKKKQWNSDEKLMKAFLKNTSDHTVTIPDIAEVIEFFPTGAPIIDFLRAYKSETDTWGYPPTSSVEAWSSKRTLTMNSLNGVEVREVFVGTSSNREVKEFNNWVKERYEENQKDFPSGVISLDVEMIDITTWDIKRLVDPNETFSEFCLSKARGTKLPQDTEWIQNTPDQWTSLPAKIMLGDGLTWLALISFPVKRVGPQDIMTEEGTETSTEVPEEPTTCHGSRNKRRHHAD